MTDAATAYSRNGGDVKWEQRVAKAANAVRTKTVSEEKVRAAVINAIVNSDKMFTVSRSGRVFVNLDAKTAELRIDQIVSNITRDLVWGSQ